MTHTVRNFARILALIGAVSMTGGVHAQTSASQSAFPTRLVRLIVPFPPGGSTDLVARLVAQKLSAAWTQPVLVENRAGANGAIASEYVARSAPDGYILLVATGSTHAVAPAVIPTLPYKNSDYAPVALLITVPNMLVVNPSVAAKNLPEFITLLKANPKKFNYASGGIGGTIHLAAELFKSMTGTDMTHVPYKGSGPALNDLLAGIVQCAFDNMSTVLPYVKQGRLRALGVASPERNSAAPDVPAIAEYVPNFDASTWIGLLAPAGISPLIADEIAMASQRTMLMPDVQTKMFELGALPAFKGPADFAAFVKADSDKWSKVARQANIVIK